MKLIPFTQGFFATECGVILDSEGIVREQYTNGDGYKTASVLTDDGKWITFGAHRLVALAFDPPTEDHLLLTVNHKNGDITNNHQSNLEWVTNAVNIQHGVLLNRFNARPLIVCTKDDLLVWLEDLRDAAQHFETDVETVWGVIRDKTLLDGWKLEHVKGSDKRVKKMLLLRPGEVNHTTRPVKMLDLTSDFVMRFDSMSDAAKWFGIQTTHIRIRVSTKGFPKIFRNKWVIVDEEVSFDFLTEESRKELLERGPKPIVCYHIPSNTFEVFPSANNFLTTVTGLSKKAITVRLKNGSLKPSDGWIVKVIADLDNDKEEILAVARPLVS